MFRADGARRRNRAQSGATDRCGRIRFGRGMGHGGLLNFDEAFSYALARSREAPLLFIGDDFGKTDVSVVLSVDAA